MVWDLRSLEFHTLKTKLFCRFSLYLFLFYVILATMLSFHDQGVLLQVNTGITLQMTSWHNTDIHTNTVRTNFDHFSTLSQNLVLLWWTLFEKYLFTHSNPISSVVSEIKSGVRGSYATEKVGTLKVNVQLILDTSWKRKRAQKHYWHLRKENFPPYLTTHISLWQTNLL